MPKRVITPSPVAIRPELADFVVPISEVKPWPGNPRRGDLDSIKESLRLHGQYARLLVQASTGYAVKGNNTLQAMIELGATEVAVQLVDLTDDQARQILLVDNRTSDKAQYDERELATLLADLESLEGTGWLEDELDDLLRSTDMLGDEAGAFLNDLDSAPPPAPITPAAPPATAAPAALDDPESDQVASDTPYPTGPDASVRTAEGSGEAPAPPATASDYVTMSYTVRTEQATLIRNALKALREVAGLANTGEALAALCTEYLERPTA